MNTFVHSPAANVLYSKRLILVPPRAEDFEACARMWEDESTTVFMGGKPFTREQVWSRLLRHVGHWAVVGFGFWTLRDRQNDNFVGEAGFYYLHRDVEPSLSDRPEAGWVLAPEARGKGLAREAVATIHAWGDQHLNCSRTVCLIDPLNLPSMQVALQCGYQTIGRAIYQGTELVLLERHRKS